MSKRQLDEIFEILKEANINDLMNSALYEPNPAKKAVYKSLYEYALDERQNKIINRKNFVR